MENIFYDFFFKFTLKFHGHRWELQLVINKFLYLEQLV